MRWYLLAVLALPSCQARSADQGAAQPLPRQTTDSNPAGGAVSLQSVTPDSVRFAPNALHELVLRGRFRKAGEALHDVAVGPVLFASVPGNADGTEIRVTLPERYAPAGGGPPRPLMPGTYDITVRVADRTSNPVAFRVLP